MTDTIDELYKNTEIDPGLLQDPQSAHLVIEQNNVLSMQTYPGLEVSTTALADGVGVDIQVSEGLVIDNAVHLCFGFLPESGVQKIMMKVNIGKHGRIPLLAHCIFPNAVDIKHIMDAQINLEEGAEYTYWEKHIHGEHGGVEIYPKAMIQVGKKARFKTDFELLQGRVGLIDIDYEADVQEEGVLEMTARISGRGEDKIKIKEVGHLSGAYARGLLTSKIAVRDKARAEIHSTLTATAPHACGHVDCHEIVQDDAFAVAIPIVEVHHPKARITHEAALGSVNSKQLETLMSRGISEEDAVELIIQGMLR